MVANNALYSCKTKATGRGIAFFSETLKYCFEGSILGVFTLMKFYMQRTE